MHRLIISLWAVILSTCVQAQMMQPVHFTSQLKNLQGSEAEIIFTALIDEGWHVYSTDLGNDGPVSATFNVVKMDGIEPVGKLQTRGKIIKQFDKLFDMELRFFEHEACFVQKVRFTKPTYSIDCYLEYGACNDKTCMPPTQVEFKKSGTGVSTSTAKAETSANTTKGGEVELQKGATGATEAISPDNPSQETNRSDSDTISNQAVPQVDEVEENADLWTPVINEMKTMGAGGSLTDHSLLYILLIGFVGGLLAVLMPCIWPIIPMTVSFFLKRAKSDRKKGIRDAITYGLSIIVIYLGLGLLVTAFFGSDTLNAMSTNAVFNIFLFLLLVIFALSFFGWFEIKLPGSWTDKVDSKASETSGLLSIFLMAFTLVLVSFSCTAPIIGLLLVETTTSGNWLAPALGMFGFALALALPFTLFALFPTWLKQAPKSGSWMTTLKIVLGFIELAFALKFLSVADLAYGWHILDREVFISLWIVIFALLGLYLLGLIAFPHDDDSNRRTSVTRFFLAVISLSFAMYMVPGLWGAPLRAISAFAPPMSTQDWVLGSYSAAAPASATTRFDDMDKGLVYAQEHNMPVFLDFNGYGCVNCRKMEAAVLSKPQVEARLANYVIISLIVDDKTALEEPLKVVENGKERTLKTVGDKWSYLQRSEYGANAQPYYIQLSPEGERLSESYSYDEDADKFLQWLIY